MQGNVERQGAGIQTLRFARTCGIVVCFFLAAYSTYLGIGAVRGLVNPASIVPAIAAEWYSPGLVLELPDSHLTTDQWRYYQAAVVLPAFISSALSFLAAVQVPRILDDAICGRVFTRKNASRIRLAGLVVLGVAASQAFRAIAFSSFLDKVVMASEYLSFRTDLGLRTGVLGGLILAVSQVMRRGVLIQEEIDLTV